MMQYLRQILSETDGMKLYIMFIDVMHLFVDVTPIKKGCRGLSDRKLY